MTTAYPDSFYADILRRVGAPLTARTLTMCQGWQACEGAHAGWNPWDTTWYEPGATPYNTFWVNGHPFHVWNYPTAAGGVEATVKTLSQSEYSSIVAHLRAEDPIGFGRAIDASPWGTKGVEAWMRNHFPPPQPVPAWYHRELAYPPPQNPGALSPSGQYQAGYDVRTVQYKLGFSNPDSLYGPGTKAAVQSFQTHHGLSPDGIVGPDTASHLGP